MPLTDREEELLSLLEKFIAFLQSKQSVDPTCLDPFGPEDAAVQR